jgi:hypothetical protein
MLSSLFSLFAATLNNASERWKTGQIAGKIDERWSFGIFSLYLHACKYRTRTLSVMSFEQVYVVYLATCL